MLPVKNPCKDCKPPQRHAYCHCEGQCAKGDAYQRFVEYRRWLNLENFKINATKPAVARDRKFSNRFDFKMRTS